jgi:hypothetical protein
MAKQERNDKSNYLEERSKKRICYVKNNFEHYREIGKILQWLDRSFDLIPIKDSEKTMIVEINQSIDKVLELAKALEKARSLSD